MGHSKRNASTILWDGGSNNVISIVIIVVVCFFGRDSTYNEIGGGLDNRGFISL